MAGAVIAMAQTWHVGPVAVKFGPLGRETCVMGGLRWFSVMGAVAAAMNDGGGLMLELRAARRHAAELTHATIRHQNFEECL